MGLPPLIILGLSTGLTAKFVLAILAFLLCSPLGEKAHWQKEEEGAEPVGWKGFHNSSWEDFW